MQNQAKLTPCALAYLTNAQCAISSFWIHTRIRKFIASQASFTLNLGDKGSWSYYMHRAKKAKQAQRERLYDAHLALFEAGLTKVPPRMI